MSKFRVHFDFNGNTFAETVQAETPDEAASIIRKRYKGAIVTKTKVDRT